VYTDGTSDKVAAERCARGPRFRMAAPGVATSALARVTDGADAQHATTSDTRAGQPSTWCRTAGPFGWRGRAGERLGRSAVLRADVLEHAWDDGWRREARGQRVCGCAMRHGRRRREWRLVAESAAMSASRRRCQGRRRERWGRRNCQRRDCGRRDCGPRDCGVPRSAPACRLC